MRPEDIRYSRDALRDGSSDEPVRVTWLGTAGFRIEHEGTTILIDPYFSRPSLARCAVGKVHSDARLVARYAPRADAIVAGHTHFDHVLDVPSIAKATGAKVFGSRSCAALCHLAGVPPSQVVDVEDAREPVRAEIGPFELRFLPSAHSPLLMGNVPFPGDISDCDQIPMRITKYRCGAVFGVELRVRGKRIYHLGSANLLDAQRSPDVDLLLMCVAGWTTTERFVDRAMSAFSPRAILFSHWDDFFAPLEKGATMLPAMRMPRLVDSLSAIDPSVKIGTLPFLEHVEI